MCWGCLLQRCWWHHPSCPCWLRSCSNKTTDTSLVGADVFMACTQSSGQESPQETSPLGENKTFPNLPLYNLIALQSFVKTWVKHSSCIIQDVTPTFRCPGEGSLSISYFSLPGYMGQDTHRAGTPAVTTFTCLTQLLGRCEHPSWC